MTVDEIRSNIRYNENLIDQYQATKKKLELEIQDLETLRSRFKQFQERFGDQQASRKRRLSFFGSSGIQNQIVTRFFSGMSSLLSGVEFQNAYNGLDDARERINREIRKTAEELEQCEDDIQYRRNRRDYWKAQLRQAMEAEEDD